VRRWWPFLLALILIAGVAAEGRTSFLQSLFLARMAGALTYGIQPGPSDDIRFPRGGPDDKRRGYSDLPGYLTALRGRDYTVVRQASWSPELKQSAEYSGYAIYHEKKDAGLNLIDRSGKSFYRARYPERTFEDFQAIPPLVVDTLRFIEDRSLLNPNLPRRNPAINWTRFTRASMGRVGGAINPSLRRGGASTLATQIEKFRHYPDGLTRTVNDKFGQMLSAATRSYLDGPETIGAQQRIIWTYLNSTPLSARAGYGEIIGIADGLWAWYGTDIEEANLVLAEAAQATPARKAELFKQVLSLLLAQRRPSYYLLKGRDELTALTNNYLRLLADAGVIDGALRDAALRQNLAFLPEAPSPPALSFVARKATLSVQTEMLNLLGTSSLYDLDRLDVTASTTFDATVQSRISDILAHLGDREQATSLGLVGPRLLGSEDPSRMAYSVAVYERGSDRNFLRVHADSVNQPFDLNSGSKLILGSTAKLRTLVTFLGIVTRLHDEYETLSSHLLWEATGAAKDPLTHWATAYLAQATDRGLQPMLDAAMQRRYSASPGESFFTGGGIHVFQNFERSENSEWPTVEQAFINSINLAFIRVMRDVRDYYIADQSRAETQTGETPSDARRKYLARFADEEGSTYLRGFYDDFRGRSPGDVLALLAGRSGRTAKRLTSLFRSVAPSATVAELRDFLTAELPKEALGAQETEDLYDEYDPEGYSLSDRAYIVGAHPLSLWLAAYLRDHPGATLTDILGASGAERQDAYDWLFKTRSTRAQDERIRTIREQDAFERIVQDWRNQGYPFAHLVPSLATAIGSSGDRPDALAELMGIILNDGLQLPTVDIEQLQFAAGTPYETQVALAPKAPIRVFAPEIARTLRRALTNVVSSGTALRLRGAFVSPDGVPLAVGGKTGTGDNRFKTFGPGHQLMESRVVDRTATFVFFLGDRFYGTVTGYVVGPEAANYRFTSSLAVQLLKELAPELGPLIGTRPAPNVSGVEPRTRQIGFAANRAE